MGIDHKFSNTAAVSIQELLQGNATFRVPRFQRNYAWKKDRVDALWSDITENFMLFRDNPDHAPDAEYLLGSVVLVKGNKPAEFFIIDGQQRLSTLTMLFCVARDIIREHIQPGGHTTPAGIEKINEMIENTTLGEHRNWKLELNDTDRNLFSQIQAYEEDEKTQARRFRVMPVKTPSEKLLRDNYLFLYEKMYRALELGFDFSDNARNIWTKSKSSEDLGDRRRRNIKMLNYFIAYIKEYNFVVKVMVEDDSSAFQIFETLNERGQTLSKSNLIKNHILNKLDKSDKAAQQDLSDRWNKVFDEIIGQEQRDDAFILESLRSRHFSTKHKMSIKNLYKITKELVFDEKSCKEYIKNLEADAKFLTMLNDTSSYSDINTSMEIDAMKALDAKSIRVPVLAAYRRWGFSDEYRKLVKLLVKFFFKFRTVREKHPGKVDKIVTETAKDIVNNHSLRGIISKIKRDDNHEDFLHEFDRSLWSLGDHAKYILQQISLYLDTPEDDVRSIESLALERILPANHSEKYWPKSEVFANTEDAADLDEYIDRIGNMTILKSAIDPDKQDMPFVFKKDAYYDQSPLAINSKTVCTESRWGLDTIMNRQKKLSKYADKIWDLSTF